MVNVYIDSRTNVDYSAFYIVGLYDLFGRQNVIFTDRHFRELTQNGLLKLVISYNKIDTKYIIDWGDGPSIDEKDYHWCDHYGKVNFNIERTPKQYHQKVVKLAPGFGIKLWNTYLGACYGIYNYIKLQHRLVGIKPFLSPYYKQTKHVLLNKYNPVEANSNYIYSLHTLWNSDEWINNDDTVNRYRANFAKACQSLSNIIFEGGFVYSQIKNEKLMFQDLLIDTEWIPKSVYLEKVKSSIVVFNTPAWALCHGWKLGEYLALGKAIISTPIMNELPQPLEHGKHVHIVSGTEKDSKEAIEFILANPSYRKQLENNAYQYYLDYVAPVQSIKLLLRNQFGSISEVSL